MGLLAGRMTVRVRYGSSAAAAWRHFSTVDGIGLWQPVKPSQGIQKAADGASVIVGIDEEGIVALW